MFGQGHQILTNGDRVADILATAHVDAFKDCGVARRTIVDFEAALAKLFLQRPVRPTESSLNSDCKGNKGLLIFDVFKEQGHLFVAVKLKFDGV